MGALEATCGVGKVEAAGGVVSDDELFSHLVRAITFSQISVKAGQAIMTKLHAALGLPYGPNDGLLAPGMLARVDDKALCAGGVGYSRGKCKYIRALCASFAAGEISAAKVAGLSDRAVANLLTSLHGIGDWCAGAAAQRSHRRRPASAPPLPLAFPAPPAFGQACA